MPNFSATTPLTCRPFPPHPATVNPHIPINHDRHKSVGLGVLELHNLMPLSCQLSPAAGFSGFCSIASNSSSVHALGLGSELLGEAPRQVSNHINVTKVTDNIVT